MINNGINNLLLFIISSLQFSPRRYSIFQCGGEADSHFYSSLEERKMTKSGGEEEEIREELFRGISEFVTVPNERYFWIVTHLRIF